MESGGKLVQHTILEDRRFLCMYKVTGIIEMLF